MKLFLVFYVDRISFCNHWLLFYFFFFWSINYSLHFGSVKIHKHCLYWKVFIFGKHCLYWTYIERLFSTACCFFNYICWSVNCISWVSKFHNAFSDVLWTWNKIYIWELEVLSFMESLFPTFRYFYSFFHLVCKFSRNFFSHFIGE